MGRVRARKKIAYLPETLICNFDLYREQEFKWHNDYTRTKGIASISEFKIMIKNGEIPKEQVDRITIFPQKPIREAQYTYVTA